MKAQKLLKLSILAFSVLMFIWQSKTAIEKLQEQPVVDKTEYKNIDNITKPIITICPQEQFDQDLIEEYGYGKNDFGPFGILKGAQLREPSSYSWQGWKNVTFDEMVHVLLKYDPEDVQVIKDENDFMNKKYYPRYGYCWQILNYTTKVNIFVLWPKKIIGNVQISITDRNVTSFNSFDRSTDMEYTILLDKEGIYEYRVSVELASNFDPRDPEACRKYTNDDFAECKEKENEKLVEPFFGCNPPWLSRNNHCTGNFTLDENKSWDYHFAIGNLYENLEKNVYSDAGCKKPCNVARSFAKKRGFMNYDFQL